MSQYANAVTTQGHNDGISCKKPMALRNLLANVKHKKPRVINIFESKSENILQSVILIVVNYGAKHNEFSRSVCELWA
jgi:hypothetical protein